MKARLTNALLSAVVATLTFLPQVAQAQQEQPQQRREGRFALGIGWARFVPTLPIAAADGQPSAYKLDDAGASVVALDYWYTSWLGTRLSYHWLRTDLAEPEGPSFARIYSGYLGALLSPGQVIRGVRPYVTLGAGLRRYDVSAIAMIGTEAREIAPRQNRLAAYAGGGVAVRTPWVWIVPEAGVFANSFRHEAICQTCTNERDRQLDIMLSLQVQFR